MPPHVGHGGVVVKFLLGPAGAYMGQAGPVQNVQRPAQAGEAPVQAVVVGGEAQVEA